MAIAGVCWRTLPVVILTMLASTTLAQQIYPSKPIRLIVPYPPGGSTNTVARLVGQELTKAWGQPVIVDNRPGGNTVIGTEALVKSSPDGHSLLLTTLAHVIYPILLPVPYDPIKDFAAVATVSSTEIVMVLHPSVQANNLRDFIALAKARPGQLNYAMTGAGGLTHLAGELISDMAGIRMQHVPYKGAGPALADLLGGQVQLAFQNPILVIPHVKSGKLKAIAITGSRRLSLLPQVPTFNEAGLPGYDLKTWFGFLAPANTPKPVVKKLSAEIARLVALPDIADKLLSQGMDPYFVDSEQFVALMRADMSRIANVIKKANIKLE